MKLVKHALRIDDCAAWDRGDLDDDEATQLTTALYEVIFEVDVETGTIITVNGKPYGEFLT
jgi:hypothetical protein